MANMIKTATNNPDSSRYTLTILCREDNMRVSREYCAQCCKCFLGERALYHRGSG
jgi:hypothetical protein